MLLRVILSLMLIVPKWAQTQASTLDSGGLRLDTPARQYLLGDWGGIRTELAEKGIVFDFFYISDSQGNPTGGLERSATRWERVRGTIDIDFSPFMRWQGLRFHAYRGRFTNSQGRGRRVVRQGRIPAGRLPNRDDRQGSGKRPR